MEINNEKISKSFITFFKLTIIRIIYSINLVDG